MNAPIRSEPPRTMPAAAAAMRVACASCTMRELCMPAGLSLAESQLVDGIVQRRAVAQGELLYRADDPFEALFAVRSGSFKTRVVGQGGRDQVTGFQLAGDLLGLDGIAGDRHVCDAMALEQADVCVLPYAQMGDLCLAVDGLQRHLMRVLSREIVSDQRALLVLGSLGAQERLAVFLLDLAQRLHARGGSRDAFVLPMSREDLGSHLGLTLETVSRTFSRLAATGVLEVRRRRVRIVDRPALQQLAGPLPRRADV